VRRLLLREVRLREVDRRALLRRLARRRGFDTLLDFERLREREAEEPLFTLLTEGSRGVLALLLRRVLRRAAGLRRVRRAARRLDLLRRLLLGEGDGAGAGAFGTLDRR